MPTITPLVLSSTIVGLTCSTLFIGGNVALSLVAIPALLLPSPESSASVSEQKTGTPAPHLSRQWHFVYDTAKSMAIPIIIVGATSYGVASFYNKGLQLQQGLQAAAAVVFVTAIPYTLTVMASTNDELHTRAADADKMGEMKEGDMTEVVMPTTKGVEGMRTEDLLKHWATLNLGRAAIPGFSIACALFAVFW